MAHSTKKLDLTNQRYGRLTVLRAAANIDGQTAWLCLCDCGRETVVKTRNLRRGSVKSCGCSQAERTDLKLNYVDGTCVEMLQAKTVRRNNTSGVPGVDWRASKQVWRAAICFKRKRYHLGSYRLFEEAVQARQMAEARLHDRFLQEFERTAGKERRADS